MGATRRSALVVAAVLALSGCGGGSTPKSPVAAAPTSTGPSATGAPAPAPTATTAAPTTATTAAPDPCAVAPQSPPKDTVAADFATALAFAPDGRLFFAERSGAVKVVQDGTTRTFATVATVTTEPGGGYSERGLLGLALSPTFAKDHFVFTFSSSTNRSQQEITRWTDCAGEGRDAKVIVVLPAGSDCCHKGGRLAFGPDGKLYVTLGEEHTPAAAADTSDVRGKVLRFNADGTVPGDNPFGTGNPVWASGLRNPFGLAISPAGRMAVTVNGPTGDNGAPGTGYDLVLTDVGRGAMYQWPACYGYSHPIRGASCDGIEPNWSSEARTVVPTGATFVNASGPAAYAGKLVVCTLNQGMLVVADGSPHASVAAGESGCRLDVKQGPDNALYFSDTEGIHRAG